MIEWFTPEVVTAVGVGLGALLGGLSALIKEMRDYSEEHEPASRAAEADTAAVPEALDEEFQHLSRTIWIVEKRLSDRLQRIEAKLGVPGQTPGQEG